MNKRGNYDLQERLTLFSVRIIGLLYKVKFDFVGVHLRKQLLRSSTSVALNYAEATSAESRRDFIHKMKIGLKELRESKVCLDILYRAKVIPSEEMVRPVMKEWDELTAIFVRSIMTARSNETR